MKRRIIAFLMALCMTVGLVPMTAFAEDVENPSTYKLTFDPNGGLGEAKTQDSATVVYPAENPAWENDAKKFVGWNTQADGMGTTPEAGTALTADMTLFAQWADRIEVTFDADGGQFSDGKNESKKWLDKDVRIGTLPAVTGGEEPDPNAPFFPEAPVKAGYTFLGWNEAKDATEPQFFKNADDQEVFELKLEKTVTLHAVWQANPDCKVTFEVKGGKWQENDSTIFEATAIRGLVPQLPTPIAEDGYYGGGWQDPKPVEGAACTDGQNFVYEYAKEVTVTFTVEGGAWDSSEDATYTVTTVDGKLTEIPTAQPDETHEGEGTWSPVPNTDEVLTADTTYTLIFAEKQNEVEVTFTVVGGTWDNGKDATYTVTTVDGKLTEIPTAQPDEAHEGEGTWSPVPNTDDVLTADTTYTLTFAEKQNEVEVTFTVVGGTWDNGEEATYKVTTVGGKLPAIPTAQPDETHEGEGTWSPVPNTDDVLTADTTYTLTFAEKQPETVTVTFDVDGETTEIKVNVGESLGDKMPTDPEKTGYDFGGWWIGDKEFTKDTVVAEDVTVTAKWDPKPMEYTVKYNPNGGAFTDKNEDGICKVASGSKLPAPPEVTREGYACYAWNTKADGSGKSVGSDTVVTGDMEVFAQWKKLTFTVTFDDGVSGKKTFTVAKGDPTPDYKPAERKGYVFMGWNPAIAETVTGNADYKAVWSEDRNGNGKPDEKDPHYTVYYNDGVYGKTIFAEQKYADLLIGTTTPSFDGTPKRDGYTFMGWNTKRDGTGDSWSGIVSKTVTYYAQWDAEDVTVTFIDRGVIVDTVTVDCGEDLGEKMPEITRKGYTLRWYTKENGKGTRFRSTTDVTEDMTVYAYWVKRDTTNAKTGDLIMRWVAVLTIAGAGLAGVAVYAAKKRKK